MPGANEGVGGENILHEPVDEEREEPTVDPDQEQLIPDEPEEGSPLEVVPELDDEWVLGPVDRTAPDPPPQEHVLHLSISDFTRMEEGGMQLHFTPVKQMGPAEFHLDTPTITVEFDQASWEVFKYRCLHDGNSPTVKRAKTRIFGPNGDQPLN